MALFTLSIFAFPDKNMFIWMYSFTNYLLYINNKNAYIYPKIVNAQIGLEVGEYTIGYFS